MAVGDISERMFRALCVQLIRAGKLDGDDIDAAADELSAQGDDDAANTLRCFTLYAAAPSQSEWIAEQRRKQMRPIDGGRKGDGGKPTD